MAQRSNIRAGNLNRRVAFDRRVDIDDGYGNTKGDWQEQFICWAEFTHKGGSEAVIASRLEGRNVLNVFVRTSTQTRQVLSDWRMRDMETGATYNIDVIDAVTDRQWTYLQVTTGVAE